MITIVYIPFKQDGFLPACIIRLCPVQNRMCLV